MILGTTDRRAKSLWLSFCLLFLSNTIFFEAGDEAAPSGELESYDPEIASSNGQLFISTRKTIKNSSASKKVIKKKKEEPVVFKLFVLEEGAGFPVIVELLVDIVHFPTVLFLINCLIV